LYDLDLLMLNFIEGVAMTDIATSQELSASLMAYVKHFQLPVQASIQSPNSPDQLEEIASSILTFQQKQGMIAIAPAQFDNLIQQAVAQFSAENFETAIVDPTTQALVQDVHQWQQTLDNQVLDTLTAYVQQFQPEQLQDLSKTILSIVPLVDNVQLRKLDADSLIQRVTSQFDAKTAMEKLVGAEPIAIAEKLSKSLQFGDLEALLKETILGNSQSLVDQLNQPIENITEGFVNSKLAELLGNNALQMDIDVDAQQIMVKQVTFKLNIMQSSPTPTKSVAEINKQIDDVAKVFLEDRKTDLDFTHLFNRS
jgi:hypothetical protein